MKPSEDFDLATIEWAARECTWQRSGEMSVLWMIKGWNYMNHVAVAPLQLSHILDISVIVEPRSNDGRLRDIDVRVGFDHKMPWREVPESLEKLIAMQDELEPAEWYRQYEEIHPFKDGNGRTGSILFNWLGGAFDGLQEPPDFWNYRTEDAFQRLVHGSRY